MSTTTLTSNHSCDLSAHMNGIPIGEIERITYLVNGNAAMGTITFTDCIADPRGCDIQINHIDDHNRTTKEVFKHVELSDNLFLGAVIVFVTDEYSKETP